ncbi:MAG: PEP-utilizing enzyme [Colwellia sp.]
MTNFIKLLSVNDTFPLDIIEMNKGRTETLDREPQNSRQVLVIFNNKTLDYYIDEKSFYRFGTTLLNEIIQDHLWLKNMTCRSESFIAYVNSLCDLFSSSNFNSLDKKSLIKFFSLYQDILYMNGLEFHDEGLASSTFGFSIQEKLKTIFKSLNYEPNEVIPLIFLADTPLPQEVYEQSLSFLALKIIKNSHIEKSKNEPDWVKNRVKEIQKEFCWIKAGWKNTGISYEEVENELSYKVELGENFLKFEINEKSNNRKKRLAQKRKFIKELAKRLMPDEKKLVETIILSVELGRKRIDAIYKLIFYSNRLYKEIALRINTSVTDLRFYKREEVIMLVNDKLSLDYKIVDCRKSFCSFIFKKGDISEICNQEEVNKLIDLSKTRFRKGVMEGQVVYGTGKYRGKVKVVENHCEILKMNVGDILVSSRTYPDIILAMKKAAVILTELGGILSHAAIVCRELQIPCVVGIENIVKELKDGDFIEVDFHSGTVKVLEV